MFVYSPESKESLGGLRLIRKADIHLGNIFGIIISISIILLLLLLLLSLFLSPITFNLKNNI